MTYSFDLSRTMTCDVAVVGGGTAGVFAAIAAARSGAKTVLIEKNNVPGGTMTVADVCYPGLFFAWGKRIIGGPCWESVERTIALGGAELPPITFKPVRHWHEQIRMNRFVYTHVLFEMLCEAGVELLASCMLSHISEEDDGLTLLVTGKSGLFAVKAKTAIDATGDANLCAMAGYALMKSPTQQPATLSNHLSGYTLTDEIREAVRCAGAQADLPPSVTADRILHYLDTHKFNMHIPSIDAETSEGKTALERRALEDMMKVYAFCRSIKGLENLTVDYVAQETGVRETNRVLGETVITAEDYIRGVRYPDSVCYAFYPIDLHVMDGIEQTFHEENVVAKIPYRALIPKGSRRILCAGRCISSDTYANSAVRVEAVCMATGQAAGVAAALCAAHNIPAPAVDYAGLCRGLQTIGAILPE